MTVERWIRTIAGIFILASVTAYHFSYPQANIFTQLNWLMVTMFVGLNLFQSGLTGWCLLGNILKRLGLANENQAMAGKAK